MVTEMFKLQIKWKQQGNWEPCVYPPTEYAVAYKRWEHYKKAFPEHTYQITQVK